MTDIRDAHFPAAAMSSKQHEVGLLSCPSCGGPSGPPGVCACGAHSPIRPVTRNAAGHVVRPGSSSSRNGGDTNCPPSQLWYCGRSTGPCRCGQCPPGCGPLSGCPCDACVQLIRGWRVNKSRRLAKPGLVNASGGDTKLQAHLLLYCGSSRACRCGRCATAECGPDWGCPCVDCLELVGMRLNKLGVVARPGSATGMAGDLGVSARDAFYCGQDVTCRCDKGCIKCGPHGGCPCPACVELLGHRINSDGVLARHPDPLRSSRYGGDTLMSAEDLYYCGRSMQQCRCGLCDGVCGPDQGCPCNSCLQLVADSLPRRGEGSMVDPFEQQVQLAVWNMEDPAPRLERTFSTSPDQSRSSQLSLSSLLLDHIHLHPPINIPLATNDRPRLTLSSVSHNNPPVSDPDAIVIHPAGPPNPSALLASTTPPPHFHATDSDSDESALDVWFRPDSNGAVQAYFTQVHRRQPTGPTAVATSNTAVPSNASISSNQAVRSRRHSADGVQSHESDRVLGARLRVAQPSLGGQSTQSLTTSYDQPSLVLQSSLSLTTSYDQASLGGSHATSTGRYSRSRSLSHGQRVLGPAVESEGNERVLGQFAAWQQQQIGSGSSTYNAQTLQSILTALNTHSGDGNDVVAGAPSLGFLTSPWSAENSQAYAAGPQPWLSSRSQEGAASTSAAPPQMMPHASQMGGEGSHLHTRVRTVPWQIQRARRERGGYYHMAGGSDQTPQLLIRVSSPGDSDACLAAWAEEEEDELALFGRISINDAEVQALLAQAEEVPGQPAGNDALGLRDQQAGSQVEVGQSERPIQGYTAHGMRPVAGVSTSSHTHAPVLQISGGSNVYRHVQQTRAGYSHQPAVPGTAGLGEDIPEQRTNTSTDATSSAAFNGRLASPRRSGAVRSGPGSSLSHAPSHHSNASHVGVPAHGRPPPQPQYNQLSRPQHEGRDGPDVRDTRQYSSEEAYLQQEALQAARREREAIRAARTGGTFTPIRPPKAASLLGEQFRTLRQTALTNRHTCVVCMDRPRCIALVPCGHFFYCAECAARIINCSICRAYKANTLRVYL